MVQSFKIDLMKGLTLTANANWYYSEGYYENFTQDYESTRGYGIRLVQLLRNITEIFVRLIMVY